MDSRFLSYGKEKYSVAGRFSRPPLENLKDVDTTKVDSTVFQEEIVLDDEGNPIIREVPAKKAEDESATGTATTEEKKEKKKAKPTEQPINFDDL